MRKILTVLVLLACLVTAVFAVGCTPKEQPEAQGLSYELVEVYRYTGSFSGSVEDWIKAIQATDDQVEFVSNNGWASKVSYKGLTIDFQEGSEYLGYFINESDINSTDQTADPFVYGGSEYYASGLLVNQLTAKKGFKILFCLTYYEEGDLTYTPHPDTKKAIVFEYIGA